MSVDHHLLDRVDFVKYSKTWLRLRRMLGRERYFKSPGRPQGRITFPIRLHDPTRYTRQRGPSNVGPTKQTKQAGYIKAHAGPLIRASGRDTLRTTQRGLS